MFEITAHISCNSLSTDNESRNEAPCTSFYSSITSSQAVRTLWEYLVVNGRMPSKGDAAAPVSDGVEPRRMESRAAQGSHIVRDSCLKYGIPIPEFSGDYDDLYEEAMAERYPEWVEL